MLRFLVFDFVGVTLWSGTYTLLGYIFSREVERVIMYFSAMGASLLILVIAALAAYVGYKVRQRRKFLKSVSARRITPEELKAKMDAKENILIFDMRNYLDRNMDPVRIPGAFHVLPQHIEFQSEDLAADQEIIVYCTCPNEATSARVALQLQRMGLRHTRPLQGGLDGWSAHNLPVERLD
jgi:rhodanese-related sulfurtransferase